jgi:hypothetical protein
VTIGKERRSVSRPHAMFIPHPPQSPLSRRVGGPVRLRGSALSLGNLSAFRNQPSGSRIRSTLRSLSLSRSISTHRDSSIASTSLPAKRGAAPTFVNRSAPERTAPK